jgi:hypothetical protein
MFWRTYTSCSQHNWLSFMLVSCRSMVANRANTSFTLVGNEAGSLMSGEPFDNNRAKINECTMKPPHGLRLLCHWPERPAIATRSTPTP